METQNPKNEEISIDVSYKDYLKRVLESFFFSITFILLTIMTIGALILHGLDKDYLLSYLSFSLFIFFCCLIQNRRVLYKISFLNEEGIIRIEYMNFDKSIIVECSDKEFDMKLRQDFFALYRNWVMKLYKNDLLIFKQPERFLWTQKKFLDVERIYKTHLLNKAKPDV